MKRNHLPLGAKKMFSAASCLETAGNVRSGDFFDIGDVYNHRAGRQASGFSRRLNEDPATNLEFWQVQGWRGPSRDTLVSGVQQVSSCEGFIQVLLEVPCSRQPQAKLRKNLA